MFSQSEALSFKFNSVVTSFYSWPSLAFITAAIYAVILNELKALTLEILSSGLKFEIMTTLIVNFELE